MGKKPDSLRPGAAATATVILSGLTSTHCAGDANANKPAERGPERGILVGGQNNDAGTDPDASAGDHEVDLRLQLPEGVLASECRARLLGTVNDIPAECEGDNVLVLQMKPHNDELWLQLSSEAATGARKQIDMTLAFSRLTQSTTITLSPKDIEQGHKTY